MKLVFSQEAKALQYKKLGEFSSNEYENTKCIWIFPDIAKTFPPIPKINIEPFKYYVTSGEAVRKTEVLIQHFKEELSKNKKDAKLKLKINKLLSNLHLFLNLLKKTRGHSKYLELCKCEDGVYSGNICSRKDPKKKKEVEIEVEVEEEDEC